MNGYLILAAALLVMMIAYQIYVSRQVYRSEDYTALQRLLQILMIWLIPLIGAALSHAILSNTDSETENPGHENDDDVAQNGNETDDSR